MILLFFQVKTSAQTYDIIVKNFLELLSKSTNMNLRLLSVRLSFNNFYSIAWPDEPHDIGSPAFVTLSSNSESPRTCESHSLFQMKQSLSLRSPTRKVGSSDFNPVRDRMSVISSKYGSLTSLLDNNKKKRKHIWCCVWWKVNIFLKNRCSFQMSLFYVFILFFW